MVRNQLTLVILAIIGLLLLCGLAAPQLAPQDPAAQELPNRLLGPDSRHWLGTDELGRDVLSRIIFGARISLQVGISVVVISLLVGSVIGSLAGFYVGMLDRFINVIVINSLLAFPGIL